ncbi:MAG: hypothetical protein H7306_06575 [Bacteriovorax sp.]|nr:hypothetical protein [Rhizobacter sp.]
MKLVELIQSPALADEFERLRRDLGACHIAVTGAHGAEGVTIVAARLACSLSSAGRVLLAEGNLRLPSLADELGLSGPGLLDWDLQGPLPTQAMPNHPALSVLTAGKTGAALDAGDAQSLPARLGAAARRAREDFSCVVWDTPAATRFPDLLAVAGHCDGVLVVVEMDRSRVDGLQFLRDTLERAQVRILGCVLNRSGRYWPPRTRYQSASM